MNNYIVAIILGVVEGLTEFLPVSSTAHLRIAQQLLGLPLDSEYWKMFAVVIQLGAILAVVVYFRSRLWHFVIDFVGLLKPSRASEEPSPDKNVRPRKSWWSHPLMLVMIAFVVTAVPCFLIDKKIGEHLENLPLMAWSLIIGGIAMWAIDHCFSPRAKIESIEKVTVKPAIFIGLMQILAAAFPGTSRSMSTIAGGQMVGLSRPAALEFSFFLSIPVMLAATLYKLLQFVMEPTVKFNTEDGLVLAVGFIVSFVVAWLVIAWFMNWVRRQGFAPFAIYRILVGIAILATLAAR
jgi:undecaprenyl-diphosphatase